MPDLNSWPLWAALLFLLFTNQYAIKFFNRILSVFGIAIGKGQEADLEAERWMRSRADWAADKAFDILETTIKDNQVAIQRRDEVLMNLANSIQRNTATVSQQTDMIRILAQNAAQLVDQYDEMDGKLSKVQSHIETLWLRFPKESGYENPGSSG